VAPFPMTTEEQLELWVFNDEPEPEPDPNEPREDRKCFCVRSYQTGKVLAICPHHLDKWGLRGKEIEW